MKLITKPENTWLKQVKDFIKSKDINWEEDDYIFPPYKNRTLFLSSESIKDLELPKKTWIENRVQGFIIEEKEGLVKGEWEYERGDFNLKGFTKYD